MYAHRYGCIYATYMHAKMDLQHMVFMGTLVLGPGLKFQGCRTLVLLSCAVQHGG